MKQRFFTRTILSDFIKSVLASTSLPLIHAVSTGDYLIKDNYYIYNRNIIKCKEQGYLRKPIKLVLSTNMAIMGGFILGESLLGSGTLGSSVLLEKVTVSSPIKAGRYYLYGHYDISYNNTNPPIFNDTETYSVGDVVCHFDTDYNMFFVYIAVAPSSHEIWNPSKWQWVWSVTVPYHLIYCTRSGTLDGVFSDSTYETVLYFEPEVVDIHSEYYLSSKTYYVVVNLEEKTIDLVYNEDAGFFNVDFADYEIVRSYIPENDYPLFTEKYVSSYDYYDSYTHKKLGNLLRFYKNVYHVNLMEYYNCWNAEYLTNYYLKNQEFIEGNSTSVKLVKVPILFNKLYTIALDCESEVQVVPAFIKNNQLLQVKAGLGSAIDLTSLLSPNMSFTYNLLYFNKPILYLTINTNQSLMSEIDQTIVNKSLTESSFLLMFEDNLYLIILLPFNTNTSVVVLEGDFTDTNSKVVFNLEFLEKMSEYEFDKSLISLLSLLLIDDGVSYPFADRLIEYLLWNVITLHDEIGEDIIRVRNDISDYLVYDTNSISWSNYLRKTLYDLYCSKDSNNKLDISGYVDKNMEYYISNLKG